MWIAGNCPRCQKPTRKEGLCCKCRYSDKHPKRRGAWYGGEPDYSSVDPFYLATVAGFLCGEGSLGFACQTIDGKPSTPRVNIILHRHDADCLRKIKDTFGGSLTFGHTRPHVSWILTGMGNVRAFLNCVLPFARSLNSAKVDDIEILLEYCNWRISLGRMSGRGFHLPDEVVTIQRSYYEKLKSVKVRG